MNLFWRSKNKKKNGENLGSQGEDIASRYLSDNGYKIIERNWCNSSGRRMGEIDIIAQKDEEIVFVEVKTRELKKHSQTLPEENIDRNKLYKMNKAASFYIKSKNLWDKNYRFDAIAVWVDSDNIEFSLKHLKNIFI